MGEADAPALHEEARGEGLPQHRDAHEEAGAEEALPARALHEHAAGEGRAGAPGAGQEFDPM